MRRVHGRASGCGLAGIWNLGDQNRHQRDDRPCAPASPAGNGPGSYQGHGVSFHYPARWAVESAKTKGDAGNKLWTTTVGPGTELDLITVTAYGLKRNVTAQDMEAIAPVVRDVSQRGFASLGGKLQAGPEQISMGGMPALRFRGIGRMNGSQIESTLVFAFSGRTEYLVNCQSTQSMGAVVGDACNQVVNTFEVHGG